MRNIKTESRKYYQLNDSEKRSLIFKLSCYPYRASDERIIGEEYRMTMDYINEICMTNEEYKKKYGDAPPPPPPTDYHREIIKKHNKIFKTSPLLTSNPSICRYKKYEKEIRKDGEIRFSSVTTGSIFENLRYYYSIEFDEIWKEIEIEIDEDYKDTMCSHYSRHRFFKDPNAIDVRLISNKRHINYAFQSRCGQYTFHTLTKDEFLTIHEHLFNPSNKESNKRILLQCIEDEKNNENERKIEREESRRRRLEQQKKRQKMREECGKRILEDQKHRRMKREEEIRNNTVKNENNSNNDMKINWEKCEYYKIGY